MEAPAKSTTANDPSTNGTRTVPDASAMAAARTKTNIAGSVLGPPIKPALTVRAAVETDSTVRESPPPGSTLAGSSAHVMPLPGALHETLHGARYTPEVVRSSSA